MYFREIKLFIFFFKWVFSLYQIIWKQIRLKSTDWVLLSIRLNKSIKAWTAEGSSQDYLPTPPLPLSRHLCDIIGDAHTMQTNIKNFVFSDQLWISLGNARINQHSTENQSVLPSETVRAFDLRVQFLSTSSPQISFGTRGSCGTQFTGLLTRTQPHFEA